MNRSKEINLLYVILILSISLLVVVAFFVSEKFKQANYSFQGIRQSSQTLTSIHNIETGMFKTGYMVRSHVIKKDTNVLIIDSLIQKYGELKHETTKIGELSMQKWQQLKVIDSLDELLDRRFVAWKQLSELPDTATSFADSLNNVISMRGVNISAQIFGITSLLKQREAALLDQYVATTQHNIKIATLLLIAATLFSVSLILFAFFKLHTEIRRGIEGQIQLATKIQELDRSNTELQQFAYTASHDLQEPLRKLHTFSGRLAELEKGRLSNEGTEVITKMQGFVMRMQRLIDDLLMFSRTLNSTDTGKQVDLNKILADTRQTLSEKVMEKGATVEADKLPVIFGHESQLQQLFQNLVSNSVKYSRQGVPPHIIIKSSVVKGNEISGVKPIDVKKQFYKIMFSDNGIGFDNKYANKIFVIFQRLHGKSEYEGTGIGLATCKVVMENHHGYIVANGREGKGADFMVYFPLS